MPRRRPCPEGSNCKYQHHHQHTQEYSHGDESDKVAAKAAKAKASQWKRTPGQTLGGSRQRERDEAIRAHTNSTGKTSRQVTLNAGEAAAKRAEQDLMQQHAKVKQTRAQEAKARPSTDPAAHMLPSKRRKRAAKTDSVHSSTRAQGDIHAANEKWSCPECTLLNESLAVRCSICNSVRLQDVVVVSAANKESNGGSKESAINLADDSDCD